MEVVLRPACDRFLREVVFPGFQAGLTSTVAAMEFWHGLVEEPELQTAFELLAEEGSRTLLELDHPMWHRALYRLLFDAWEERAGTWHQGVQAQLGYAGDWEAALHVSLLLEDPEYPYADAQAAKNHRWRFFNQPHLKHGLSALLCGHWDPVPRFAPHQLLATAGLGAYEPHRNLARADWCWRSMGAVNQWAAVLPSRLNALLGREEARVAPVELPEKHEVLQYWLGRSADAPLLAVTFSGLGPRALETLHDIGRMARFIRELAHRGLAVTVVLSRPTAAPGA